MLYTGCPKKNGAMFLVVLETSHHFFWDTVYNKKTENPNHHDYVLSKNLIFFSFLACNRHWHSYNGSCYFLSKLFHQSVSTLELAQEFCRKNHPTSNLPSIHSWTEARYLSFYPLFCSILRQPKHTDN